MSTWQILILIAIVIFLFVNYKMIQRGVFYIIKMQLTEPDLVHRWVKSDSCCTIVKSAEAGNFNKKEYIGPYNVTPSTSYGQTVKYYIKRECMKEAIGRLKNMYIRVYE